MIFRMLLLFTIVPFVELVLLIKLAEYIGTGYTILAIVLTGFAGAYLAKTQGLKVLTSIQRELGDGNIPGNQIIDGLCILIGGIMLIAPGIITDAAGLMLVIPVTRYMIREWFKVRFRNMIDKGHTRFYWGSW
jgi:UPF0716 protein FxsA